MTSAGERSCCVSSVMCTCSHAKLRGGGVEVGGGGGAYDATLALKCTAAVCTYSLVDLLPTTRHCERKFDFVCGKVSMWQGKKTQTNTAVIILNCTNRN